METVFKCGQLVPAVHLVSDCFVAGAGFWPLRVPDSTSGTYPLFEGRDLVRIRRDFDADDDPSSVENSNGLQQKRGVESYRPAFLSIRIVPLR